MMNIVVYINLQLTLLSICLHVIAAALFLALSFSVVDVSFFRFAKLKKLEANFFYVRRQNLFFYFCLALYTFFVVFLNTFNS